MHCVLLGVCRQLFRLWFNNSSSIWYLGAEKLLKIDERLLSIKPPDEIQRTPRSIKSTVKYWKGTCILLYVSWIHNNYYYMHVTCIVAHELRAWLLHYSPVVLRDILQEDYYQHHLLLVDAIYMLLLDSVDKEDLMQSFYQLQHYCFMFTALYGKMNVEVIFVWLSSMMFVYIGERNCSMNVHSLLHLPDVVKDHGPLWGHSCFPFESANGMLLKLFHGTQCAEKQVRIRISLSANKPMLIVLSSFCNKAF